MGGDVAIAETEPVRVGSVRREFVSSMPGFCDSTPPTLGVYSADLTIPLGAYAAGLGDLRIVSTLCPGGKERMRRLMDVVGSGRVDTSKLVTHHFALDDIETAYELFANQRDGVMKIAVKP